MRSIKRTGTTSSWWRKKSLGRKRPQYKRSKITQIHNPKWYHYWKNWLRIIIVGVTIIIFFSIWRLTRIENVHIQSSYNIPKNSVEEITSNYIGNNIFFLDKQKIRNQIQEQIPLASTITITKKFFPHKILIDVQEAEPALIWHIHGIAYLLSTQGTVLAIQNEQQIQYPQVYGYGSIDKNTLGSLSTTIEDTPEITPSSLTLEFGDIVTSAQNIDFIVKLHEKLPQYLNQEVLFYQEGEFNDIGVYLQGGLVVWLNTKYVLESELKRLQITMQEAEKKGMKINQYIDLRFEKVYFK